MSHLGGGLHCTLHDVAGQKVRRVSPDFSGNFPADQMGEHRRLLSIASLSALVGTVFVNKESDDMLIFPTLIKTKKLRCHKQQILTP